MVDIISLQELADAKLDAGALEEVVNGSDTADVVARLGRTYPTLAKAIKIISQAGGAKAYATLSEATAATLVLDANTPVYVWDDTNNNGNYLWNGTTLTKSDYDPIEEMNSRVEKNGEGFNFKDKLGYTVFKIHSVDGVLTLESPFFKLDEISDILTVNDRYGFKFNLLDYFKVSEEKLKVLQDLSGQNSSSIDIPVSLQTKANAIMQPHLKPYRHPCATIKKGLNIVIVGGQSFSLGAQAGTIVTREPSPRGNLMLGGSPRGKHGELVDTNYTFDPFGGNVYQPLQECGQTKDGVIVNLTSQAGYYGETISSGLVESLKDYWNREKGVVNDTDVTFAISCCGTGGATHDQLKKSTGTYYNRFLTCLDGHIEAAALAGFTDVQVVGIVYLHGESMAGATKTSYKANLAEMRNDMIADIKSKFGQSDDPAFFIHQIGGDYPASVSTQMGTSQAQLEFASETPGVFICDNEFGYPTPGAHLYPNGYRWMGCRFAKRMYPVLRDKQTVPFKIIDAVYSAGAVYVAFSSPTALKTRTVYKGVTAINDPTMGFTVRNSNGAVAISNAEIISESVVKLTLAQAQSTPLTLWLGSSYNNAVHNLCDSTAEKSIFNYVYDGTMQQSSAENIAEYVGKSYPLNEKPAVQFIQIRSI